MKKITGMYHFMFRCMGKNKKRYLFACAFASMEGISGLVEPFLLRSFVDVINQQNVWIPLLLLGIIALLTPFICYSIYTQESIAVITTSELSKKIVKHAERLPMTALIRTTPEKILSYMTGDVQNVVRSIKGMAASSILQFAAMSILSFAALIFIHPMLCWYWIGYCILVFSSALLIIRYIKQDSDKNRETETEETQIASDLLSASPVLRAFNTGGYLISKIKHLQAMILSKGIKISRLSALKEGIITVLQAVFLILFGYRCYSFVQNNAIDVSRMVLAISMFMVCLRSTEYMLNYIEIIERSVVSFDRIDEFFMIEEETADYQQRNDVESDGNAIICREISFRYDGSPLLLDHLNLTVRKGEFASITGENGSGKSTLLRLMMGLYVPQDGEILINGKSDISSVRSESAYVSQNCELFDGTIFENIACSDDLSLMNSVIMAAKKASIHDEITEFPDQYDTLVGEGGRMLSVGQRQRIALARAFMKDASVLFVDEPTASLDNESESKLMDILYHLKNEKTVVLISHTERMLNLADNVYILENGKLNNKA